MRLRGRARSAALASAAAIGAGAIALPALAQDEPATELGPLDVEVDIRVIPNKAGTPRKPQPVKITGDVELVSKDPSFERPIVDTGTIRLGRSGIWNGAKHPKCTAEILNRRGLDACPPGSIFGKGYATGYADTVRTTAKITAVNGGAKVAFAYVQLTNPARVNVAVPVHIEKRRGKWAYELRFDVPESLQFVAGVPVSLTKGHGTIGKGDILVTTFCPRDRKWKYDSTTTLLDGRVVKHAGTEPCRR